MSTNDGKKGKTSYRFSVLFYCYLEKEKIKSTGNSECKPMKKKNSKLVFTADFFQITGGLKCTHWDSCFGAAGRISTVVKKAGFVSLPLQ